MEDKNQKPIPLKGADKPIVSNSVSPQTAKITSQPLTSVVRVIEAFQLAQKGNNPPLRRLV